METQPRKIRVAHILEGFNGGIATYMCTVLPELAAAGFEVTLICSLTRKVPNVESRLSRLRAAGVDIRVVRMCREINPLRDLCSLVVLLRLLLAERFDIIHTHVSKAGALGRIAGTLVGVPVRVHSPHCFSFLRCDSVVKAEVYRRLEKMLGRLTTKLLAIGPTEAQTAVAEGIVAADRCVVVDNGIAVSDTASALGTDENRIALKRSRGIDIGRRVITTVCRLVDYKGVFRFIEAADQSRAERTLFNIVGEGRLMSAARMYIDQHRLRDKVRLLGHREDVAPIYGMSDIFVLGSDGEACPYVLLEAMRAKCPIVATDVVGTRDMIQNGETGFLVEPDAKAISRSIDYLLGNPTKRHTIAENAYAHLKKSYRLERQVAEITKIYRECA